MIEEPMADFRLPLVFKQIVEGREPNYILEGGRLGGKTSNGAIMACLSTLSNPYRDIVVARVSYGSLADSSYAEFEGVIDSFREDIRDQFVKKHSPLRIERINDAGTIYFMGYGGSNTSRTKSFKPKHKIGIVILEETQELKNRENLDQALASFRRHFGEGVKVLIMGNPPAQKAHWFNIYINECKQDRDYRVVHMSWMDIVPFINDYDLKEILKTKHKNPDKYNWFYMGIPTGAFGSVYPMWDQEEHVITPQELALFQSQTGVRIVGCVIGGDGAVTRDATAFVPEFILSNGQCVIGPIFYHNPLENGQMGSHKLVQDYVTKWFSQLCEAFHLGTRMDQVRNPNARLVPIWWRIDSASTDLIQTCKFFFSDRCDVREFHKSTVMQMVDITQSAISSDFIYCIEYGGYFNYIQNKWIQTDMNILCQQLDQLIWNESQTNYDPIVPNDVCDAFTYGVNFWYGNTENINWFNIVKQSSMNNSKIRDIIKVKERG